MRALAGAVLFGLGVIVATLGGCGEGGFGEGEPCTPKFEGEASGCLEGLFCARVSGTCEPFRGPGEGCNTACAGTGYCEPLCEEGLLCSFENTCQAPGPEGTLCERNAYCAAGLICNHGYLPDDPALGECHPPSELGGPCSYGQYVMMGETGFAGCGEQLTCVAPTPTLASIVQNDQNDQKCLLGFGSDPPCGFAGVCAELQTQPLGEACLDQGACVDGGRCFALPLPVVAEGTPGFQCGTSADAASMCGPWTGLCGRSDILLGTDGMDCITGPCAPGYLCDWQGVCRPRWSLLLSHDICETYGTGEILSGEPNDDFCKIGEHCQEGDPLMAEPPTCESGFPL